MPPRAIIPAAFAEAAAALHLSPGVLSAGHLFLSGATGAVGTWMPDDPEAQFRNAFDKIGMVLKAGGLDFGAVVEMTTFHLGLRDHFDLFDAVRQDYLSDPWPAWTAVEVAALRRPGAVVEIRVVAAEA